MRMRSFKAYKLYSQGQLDLPFIFGSSTAEC
jgi:hypothetical protein